MLPHARSVACAGVALAALVACKKPPPASYVYSVFVPKDAALGVELDGKPLPMTHEDYAGKRYRLEVPSAEHAVDKKLQVTLATSCGESKVPAKVLVGITKADSASSEDYERKNLRPGQELLSELSWDSPKKVDVYLDRDGAAGAKVTVGATPLDPKADSTTVILGTCPTAGEVKVDGASVGTVTPVPRTTGPKEKGNPTALVDVKGGHCYTALESSYVQEGDHGFGPSKKELQGARVYAVDIDDFFKPSPDKLESKDMFPSRTEIEHCPPTLAPKPTTKPRRK